MAKFKFTVVSSDGAGLTTFEPEYAIWYDTFSSDGQGHRVMASYKSADAMFAGVRRLLLRHHAEGYQIAYVAEDGMYSAWKYLPRLKRMRHRRIGFRATTLSAN